MKLRLAVVQLHYRLAFNDEGWTPLEEPNGSQTRPGGYLDGWAALTIDGPAALRQRTRHAYCDQLLKRLRAVVAQCADWGVHVVVLPEYSVPWELLPELATLSPNMVVVSGSHTVERAGLEADVYANLGWPHPPTRASAVCPVLHGEKLIGLQAKLGPAPNLELHMVAGTEWQPIALPNSSERLGVLICIDFLHRETSPHWTMVGPRLDDCAFLAVPSFTSARSLSEFMGEADTQAKRYKRPVLYCNSAEHGGTTIRVDALFSGTSFPDSVGTLARGEEGVVVADVDFTRVPSGPSTSFNGQPKVVPYAVASFVYTGMTSEAEYANWIQAGLKSSDEAGLGNYLRTHPTPARGPASRVARLARLRSGLGDLSFDRMRQLTREVLLPADVAPLDLLNAASSRGASEQLQDWSRTAESAGEELLIAEARLRSAGMATAAERLNEWSNTAKVVLDAIATRVADRAERQQGAGGPIPSPVSTYLKVVDGQFSDRHAQVAALFENEAFEDAAEQWATLAGEARKLVEADPGAQAARVWEAKFRFNRAAALANLQEFELAKEALRELAPEYLPAEGKLNLAIMLLHLGHREKALLLSGQARDEGIDSREFDQLLAIHDGATECPPGASASTKLELARRLWDMHDFDRAAQLALEVADLANDGAHSRLGAVSTLVACLTSTIFERPPNGRAIPTAKRAAVLTAIDAGLTDLSAQRGRLSPRLREALREVEVVYTQLTMDHERMRELEAARAVTRLAAWSIAEDGDLASALAAIKPQDPAWLYHLQRAELFADFGTRAEALAEIEPFRGKAPIEYLRGQLLFLAGDFAEALAAAEVAMAELPIRRHQLFLARVLVQVGEAARAWPLLASFRSSSDPETLATLALAAETVEPHTAGDYWSRYTELEPKNYGAQVNYAVSLWRNGELARAAELGADVIKKFGEDMSAKQIARCARLQMTGTDQATRKQRISDAIDLLERRFAGDSRAEALRFELIQLIDPSLESHSVDWGLLEAAGAAIKAPIDDVMGWVSAAAERHTRATTLYRAGGLPFGAFCSSMRTQIATEILRRASLDRPEFCAPLMSLDSTESLSPDARLLIGATELYLLGFLGALERLKERVRDGYFTLVFAPGTLAVVLASHSRAAETAHDQTEALDLATRAHQFVAALLAQGASEATSPADVDLPLAREDYDAELVETWVRAPLKSHLALRELMKADERIVRVTADMFGSDVLVVPHTVQALNWDQADLQARFVRNRLIGARDISLPQLLRQLFSGDTLRELLMRLARLGFSDALGAAEIDWLVGHRSKAELDELFRRSDWVAQDVAHVCYESANQARLNTYCDAVWTLLKPRPPVDGARQETNAASIVEQQRKQAAAAILDVVESMDPECRYGVVQRFVQLLAVQSVGKLTLFYSRSDDEEHVVFDQSAPASLFWGWLADWATLRLSRRRASARGLQDALVWFDQHCPAGGPARHHTAPLVFAAKRLAGSRTAASESYGPSAGLTSVDDYFGLHELSGQTIAILSATWTEKPLAGNGILIEREGVVVGQADYEQTIQAASDRLGRSAELVTDGALLDFVVEIAGQNVRLDLPIEAAFLRMDDERVQAGAAYQAAVQGPLDGQLYEALMALGASPSLNGRRRYAQLACTALFRRVRHDPTFLLRWATTRGRFFERPALQTLREILSEPSDIVDSRSLFETIGERIQTGAWSNRVDAVTLARWVLEVPGEMSTARAWSSIEDAERRPALVGDALERLRKSDTQPICRIAADIFLLRACTAMFPVVTLSAGEVDLRAELPILLARLLQAEAVRFSGAAPAAAQRQGDKGVEPTGLHNLAPTFAEAEPKLLRVCGQVVRSLQQGPHGASVASNKEKVWLTYRLHQWLCRQLDALSPEASASALAALASELDPPGESLPGQLDAFDPRRFGPGGYPYRLAVALHAIGSRAFEQEHRQRLAKRSTLVGSAVLERLLLELAGSPEGVEYDTVFDWFAPLSVPALALSVLLGMNQQSILELTEEAQLAWISKIPGSLDAVASTRWIVWSQLIEALAGSARVSPTVRARLSERVEGLNAGPTGTQVREVGTVLLFESGSEDLEAAARDAVLARIGRGGSAAGLLGRFLCGLAKRAPEEVEAELDRALATVDALQGEHEATATELVAVGLGLLMIHGPPAARQQARDTLLRVTARPRFRDDPRLAELVQFTGGREA